MTERIEQTTVANAAENARLASIQPAAGGWQPTGLQRAALVIGSTTLGALVPVLLTLVSGPVGVALSALVGGAAAGLALLAGVNSAGPRKLP